MRKVIIVIAVAMLCAPLAVAQGDQIDNSTVNSFSPDPLSAPGTFDICFNVTVDSPDLEYMDRFDVDLPDDWTINTVTPPAGTGCSSALPVEGGTEAGNLVYFQGANYMVGGSGCGAWDNGTYDFCANITMDPYNGPYMFNWNIWGDSWGEPPHSISGSITDVVPVELLEFDVE